ncbi:MAG: cardiolipin synthase [Thiohalocapsa sp.]|nr:cardiolipin synthase [Thiohalocapsa sp.]
MDSFSLPTLSLLQHLWIYAFIAAQLTAVLLTSIHIVLSNRDVPSTVGWTGLVLLAPLLGLVLYWVFGVNRIQRKAHRLRPETSLQSEAASVVAERRAHHVLQVRFPWLASLGHLGDELTGAALESDNRITPLIDGDAAYPAMLEAIDGARHSIALSTYIFDYDEAGKRFVAALVRARQRGVAVRVLIDGVGQRYSRPPTPAVLRRQGIETGVFLPPFLPIRNQYLNLRNHRKILVVDGRIGFTGGLNIREGALLEQHPSHPVQDLHFRLDGPVVRELTAAFGLDWAFSTGERLGGDRWYPVLEPAGSTLARCVADGPDEDFDVIRRLFLGALSAARSRVRIVTPYFLPDHTLTTVLNVTALRGIDVQILIPRENNLRFVQWASEAQAEHILDGGSRMFLTRPPFDHTKLMVVDDVWCCVGSANWDPRSLRLNFELNVECYDTALAARLNGLIDAKLDGAIEIRAADMRARRLPVRLRDGFARLLTPYL